MQNKLIICILCLVASCWSNDALSEIYRWVDEEGNVHYGDNPSRADRAEDISEQVENQNIYKSVIGELPFAPYKHGREVTSSVTREDHASPLGFTSYSLHQPLLPKARLLEMVHRKDSIWFASDIGLIQFSKPDEQWYLYDRRTGLPGDTVHHLTLDGDRLLLKIYDRAGAHSLINPRHFWFDAENHRFGKSTITYDQARAGGSYTVKNSDILSNTVYNVLHYENKVWFTTATVKSGTKEWTGGVSALKPFSKRGKQYTVRDGLAHPYCYDITSSENNSVWVTHWKPERGLSVLNKYSRKWHPLKTSRNGIELGGVKIAAVDHYILIGQQRALVIYDKRSGLAFELDEARGMPGRIVSDIKVDDDCIWVGAYTYTGKDSSRGGLVKIARSELDGLYERIRDEERELEQHAK